MGAFKPLLPLGEGTVIEASVGSVMPYAVKLSAAVGYHGDEVAAVLKKRFKERVTIVKNPGFAATDMLTSVKLCLRSIGECDAFFLLPADMPLVPPEVFEALTERFDGSAEVIYPVYGGRRGHPPLIAASLIPEILAFEGEGGLRAVLSGRRVIEVAAAEEGILVDLDTPDDYERIKEAKQRFGQQKES